VLDAAMSRTGSKPFAAYLHSVRSHEIADLRLGKKTDELYAHARSCADRPLRQLLIALASTSTGLPARAHYLWRRTSPGGVPYSETSG
jgi:hypothetical protein